MSLQVNGLNTVQNYPKPQMNATFKANPVATTSTLERTPTTDKLVKPTQNKTKKTLLVFGGLALAGVATSIFAQSDNKELLATNKPSKQTNIYSNCFTMSKGNMTV